jgi:hypothetical protein
MGLDCFPTCLPHAALSTGLPPPPPCTASHPRVPRFNRGLPTAKIWAAAVGNRAGRPGNGQPGLYLLYRVGDWNGANYSSAWYSPDDGYV